MEYKILEALTERGYQVETLEDAQQQLSQREILDIFLKYEGIIGHTGTIISAMTLLGFIKESTISPYSFLIQYEQDTLALRVYVNGELKPDIKQISLVAQDMRPPITYSCEMHTPTAVELANQEAGIAAKFRNAIDKYGIPATVVVDNGTNYCVKKQVAIGSHEQ